MPDLSSLLTDLGAFLAAAGCGSLGTTLTLGQWPKNVPVGGVASSITETQGAPSNDPAGIDFPRFQVMTKSTDYAAGRARAFAIHAALNRPREAFALGSFAVLSKPLQTPFKIGMSEKQEHMFSCNFQFDVT